MDLTLAIEPKKSKSVKLLAVLCAILVTGALLVGYGYIRKRHVQQNLAAIVPVESADSTVKGPAKAKIIVDEPFLKGSDTIIGGTVTNLSGQRLSGLSVHLELRRRKDGKLAESQVSIEPSNLDPNQEGAYSVKLPAQEYASVRLIGLTGDPNTSQLAYVSAQGKQRPPERLEPKTIVITKPTSKRDQFLNSPDSPARVP
jgi:hypothetical protein